MYDFLIKNGLVVDGTGAPAVKADVAVQGDRVIRIAPTQQESTSFPDSSLPTSMRSGIALMTAHMRRPTSASASPP